MGTEFFIGIFLGINIGIAMVFSYLHWKFMSLSAEIMESGMRKDAELQKKMAKKHDAFAVLFALVSLAVMVIVYLTMPQS